MADRNGARCVHRYPDGASGKRISAISSCSSCAGLDMAFRGRAGRWAWYRARGGACLRLDGLGVLLGVLDLLSVNGRSPANQDTDLICSLMITAITEVTTQCHR